MLITKYHVLYNLSSLFHQLCGEIQHWYTLIMTNIDKIRVSFQPKRLIEDKKSLQIALEKKQNKVDRYRPNPQDFINDDMPGYTAAEVARDQRGVELLKEQFADGQSQE